MYHDRSLWHYLGAGLLAVLAIPQLIGDTAYLIRTWHDLSNWLVKTNIPKILVGYLNTFSHLVEFIFWNFGGLIIALFVWWLICKR